jgi:hypothetical protein
MLPKFDESLVRADDAPPAAPRDAAAEVLGPRLLAYWAHMTTKDAEGMRVRDEIMSGLNAWDAKGRWEPIAGAGARDDAPGTLFDMILAGDIPSDAVYEDDVCCRPPPPLPAPPLGARPRPWPAEAAAAAAPGALMPPLARDAQTASATSIRSRRRTCCSSQRSATASRSWASPPPSTPRRSAT